MVNKSGKYWRYNYRFNDKHKTLALGVYPDVSLKDVRKKHEAARDKVSEGFDPSIQKKIRKISRKQSSYNSFEVIGREWFEEFKDTWADSHSKRLIARLENDVFPWLGSRPIDQIEPPEVVMDNQTGQVLQNHTQRILDAFNVQ